MSVALVFEFALERYRAHVAKETHKAIAKSNKVGAMLLKITTDKRFRVTANPPTTEKECKKLFDIAGLDWNEFIPFYRAVLVEEKDKQKKPTIR